MGGRKGEAVPFIAYCMKEKEIGWMSYIDLMKEKARQDLKTIVLPETMIKGH